MIGAYPTADQVALAVVTAARLVDESPLAPERARYIAFAGLIEAYPDTPKRHLARLAFLGGGRLEGGALQPPACDPTGQVVARRVCRRGHGCPRHRRVCGGVAG